MATGFNIVANLQFQANNLPSAVSRIRRQLSTLGTGALVNPASVRSVSDLTNNLVKLQGRLDAVAASAREVNRQFADMKGTARSTAAMNSLAASSAKAVAAQQRVSKGLTQSTRDVDQFGRAVAIAAKRFVAFQVAAPAIYAVQGAFADALKQAAQFDREMVRVQQVGGDSARTIADLSREIGNLSKGLGVSSLNLAQVATTLRQAGLSADDVRVSLSALAKTELTPTFKDINNTVEGSIALMRQFGIGAKELEGVLGSINTVSAQFAVESEDLVEVIRKAGGAFKAASGDFASPRESLNQLLALFTSVRDTTRESADAIGTGFRTIFARLQSNDVAKNLKDLGVNLHYTAEEAALLGRNVEGQFVGVMNAVGRLSKATSGLQTTDPRFSAIAEQIGGIRQISRVLPLLQQYETTQRALSVAQTGSNSLTRDAAKANDAFLVKLTKVKEEFVDFIRVVGQDKTFQKFLDYTLKIASGLTSMAKAITPIVPALTAIGAVKLTSNIAGGFRSLASRPGRGFASGGFVGDDSGMVPGSGSGDIVPARLKVGQFVIRKSSARRIGYDVLQKMATRGYANGGTVNAMVEPKEFMFSKKAAAKIGYSKLNYMNKKGELHPDDQNRQDVYSRLYAARAQLGQGDWYPSRYASGGIVSTPHGRIKTSQSGRPYNLDQFMQQNVGQRVRLRRIEADPDTGEATARARFYAEHRKSRFSKRIGFEDGGEAEEWMRKHAHELEPEILEALNDELNGRRRRPSGRKAYRSTVSGLNIFQDAFRRGEVDNDASMYAKQDQERESYLAYLQSIEQASEEREARIKAHENRIPPSMRGENRKDLPANLQRQQNKSIAELAAGVRRGRYTAEEVGLTASDLSAVEAESLPAPSPSRRPKNRVRPAAKLSVPAKLAGQPAAPRQSSSNINEIIAIATTLDPNFDPMSPDAAKRLSKISPGMDPREAKLLMSHLVGQAPEPLPAAATATPSAVSVATPARAAGYRVGKMREHSASRMPAPRTYPSRGRRAIPLWEPFNRPEVAGSAGPEFAYGGGSYGFGGPPNPPASTPPPPPGDSYDLGDVAMRENYERNVYDVVGPGYGVGAASVSRSSTPGRQPKIYGFYEPKKKRGRRASPAPSGDMLDEIYASDAFYQPKTRGSYRVPDPSARVAASFPFASSASPAGRAYRKSNVSDLSGDAYQDRRGDILLRDVADELESLTKALEKTGRDVASNDVMHARRNPNIIDRMVASQYAPVEASFETELAARGLARPSRRIGNDGSYRRRMEIRRQDAENARTAQEGLISLDDVAGLSKGDTVFRPGNNAAFTHSRGRRRGEAQALAATDPGFRAKLANFFQRRQGLSLKDAIARSEQSISRNDVLDMGGPRRRLFGVDAAGNDTNQELGIPENEILGVLGTPGRNVSDFVGRARGLGNTNLTGFLRKSRFGRKLRVAGRNLRRSTIGRALGGGRAGYAAVGLGAAVAANLYQRAESPNEAPNASNLANAGGATGAVSGGLIGLQISPLAGAIGALVGGVLGYTTALRDAKEQIEQFHFDKSFKEFEYSLNALASGLRTIDAGSIGTLSGGISRARTEAARRTSAEGVGNFFDQNFGRNGNFASRYLDSKGFGLVNQAVGMTGEAFALPFTLAGRMTGFGSVSSNLLNSDQELLKREGVSRQAKFADIITPQLPLLQQVADKIAGSVEISRDQLRGSPADARRSILSQFDSRGGGQLAEVIASVGNLPLDEVRENFLRVAIEANEVRLQQEAMKNSVSQTTIQFQKFNRLTQALDAVTLAADDASRGLETSANIFGGGLAAGRSKDFASQLGASPAGRVGQNLDFLQANLGGGGISSQFVGSLRDIDKVLRDGSGGLSAAISGGALTPESMGSKIKEFFNSGSLGLSKDSQRKLGSAVDSLDPKDLASKATDNAQNLLEELVKQAFGDLPNQMQDLTKKIVENGDRFAQGLSRYSEMLDQAGDASDRASSLRLGAQRANAQFQAFATGRFSQAGGFTNLNTLRSPFAERQRRLAGEFAGDVGGISGRFGEVRDMIVAADSRLDNPNLSPSERSSALENRDSLIREASNLQKALEHLADASEENAAIQEKINELEKQRQAGLNLTERLLTSSPADLGRMRRSQFATDAAVSQGDFRGFNAQNVQRVLEYLRSVGDLQLPGYGNRTGNDISELLLSRSSKFLTGGGVGGFGNGSIVNPVVGDEMERLLKEQAGVAARSESAGSVLAGIKNDEAGKFFEGLKNVNGELSKFGDLLREAHKVDSGNALDRAKVREAVASRAVDQASSINTQFGVNGDGLQQLRQIMGSSEFNAFKNARSARKSINSRSAGAKGSITDAFANANDSASLFGVSVPLNRDVTKLDKAGRDAYFESHKNALFSASPRIAAATGLSNEDVSSTAIPSYLARYRKFLDAPKKGGFDNAAILNASVGGVIDSTKNRLGQTELESRNTIARSAYGDNSDAALNRVNDAADRYEELSKTMSGLSSFQSMDAAVQELSKAAEETKRAKRDVQYRAAGGPIFRKRGTDTVPAMLTPGEVVVNAKAASENSALLNNLNNGGRPQETPMERAKREYDEDQERKKGNIVERNRLIELENANKKARLANTDRVIREQTGVEAGNKEKFRQSVLAAKISPKYGKGISAPSLPTLGVKAREKMLDEFNSNLDAHDKGAPINSRTIAAARKAYNALQTQANANPSNDFTTAIDRFNSSKIGTAALAAKPGRRRKSDVQDLIPPAAAGPMMAATSPPSIPGVVNKTPGVATGGVSLEGPLGKFGEVVGKLDTAINNLAKSLANANIPSQITLKLEPTKHEVVLNGAQMLATLVPAMQDYVNQAIAEKIAAYDKKQTTRVN